RVIAATNRELGKLIEQGRFRQDLYYRLNVYTIRLPPLRERAGDLPLLAQHFIRRFSRGFGKDMDGVTPEALKLLQGYPWLGNVRELQSILKQAILQATGPVLLPENLPPIVRAGGAHTFAATSIEALDLADHLTRFVENRLLAGTTNLHH